MPSSPIKSNDPEAVIPCFANFFILAISISQYFKHPKWNGLCKWCLYDWIWWTKHWIRVTLWPWHCFRAKERSRPVLRRVSRLNAQLWKTIWCICYITLSSNLCLDDNSRAKYGVLSEILLTSVLQSIVFICILPGHNEKLITINTAY